MDRSAADSENRMEEAVFPEKEKGKKPKGGESITDLFDTFEEEYLELVGDMIKTACKAGEPQEALDNLQKYKGCGYWYDKAQAVIASFIKNIQNGRELMNFEK